PIAVIDRTEAKLVRWMDLRSIVGPFQGPGPGPLSAAPEAPVWVVALSGNLGMTSGICRGLGACPSPAPIRWSATFIDARTGAVRSTTSATSGDWPPFFDSLPDPPSYVPVRPRDAPKHRGAAVARDDLEATAQPRRHGLRFQAP